MRCKSCDYPLWNLKARQCPECGTAFKPSDFEFTINSVRFCCPHCEQSYYGTGPGGHLIPPEFNCVTCSQHIHMDEMLLRPAQGVQEEQTQIESMPWLNRRKIGFLKAWFMTIGRSMMVPPRLMRSAGSNMDVGQAWWYAAFTYFVTIALGAGTPLLVVSLIMLMNNDEAEALGFFIASVSASFGGTIAILIFAAIWGATAHGILKITGGSSFSIGRTYQGLLYSIGTCTPMGVPIAGPYCGTWVIWIWWVVSATLMVKEGQRVHGGRATLAVLAFPGASILLVVGVYIALMVALVGSASTRMATARTFSTSTFETQVIAQSIVNYAGTHNGMGPGHALELINNRGGVGASSFISSDSATTEYDVPVGDGTLNDFQLLPPGRQRLAAQAAATGLPSGTIAHRLGDFVFTYHGIDFTNAHPALWIVILLPDPSNPSPTAQPQMIGVGTADGMSHAFPQEVLAIQLGAQNSLRSQYNLAPLPDPLTVTHEAPAVAPNVPQTPPQPE